LPDLILMDIVMTGPDGLKILKTLRDRFSHIELPVILVELQGPSLWVKT